MEQNNNNFIQEVDIPLTERFIAATTQFFYTLVVAPICIVTAPFIFFKVLMTKKRKVVTFPINTIVQSGLPQTPPTNEGDDWKKEHDDLYGTEDT